MEEVCFIVTPKCAQCIPQPSFRRRYACKGCEKLRPQGGKQALPPMRNSCKPEKRARKGCGAEILRLRGQGCSYGAIAKRLKIPRSTVQAAVRRAERAVRTI